MVITVLSMPAPLRDIPAFGSSGASNSKVPGPISIVLPSAASRTAATSASAVFTETGAATPLTAARERIASGMRDLFMAVVGE